VASSADLAEGQNIVGVDRIKGESRSVVADIHARNQDRLNEKRTICNGGVERSNDFSKGLLKNR